MTQHPLKTEGDTEWFVQDRFGMFIHWGLYAMPARHEWVKSYEKMSDAEYDRYFDRFDPDLYDPNRWAEAAANAGMKYFVVTTKHHDGFCLWDSALTDYKSTRTPYGKDLLRPMVEAFRAKEMRAGLYHSLLDWRHPDYPVDAYHPMRERLSEIDTSNRDLTRYVEYLHGQTRELLTQFGKIDILWYDFCYENMSAEQWRSEDLLRLIRRLQPQIILNNRLDLDHGWDIKTPEQFQPREWVTDNGRPVVWEVCQTFSGSWGYHRDEENWKSVEMLVQMLIDAVSKGGNLLLNVGPTGRGEFDARVLERLKGIGAWMRLHSRAIYGCTQAPEGFDTPQDCRLTYNPKTHRLYVHLYAWPFKELHLDGIAGKIAYAQLLHDGSEVTMNGRNEWEPHYDLKSNEISLRLPVKKPNVTVPVIELFLK
ncbi:alpha-L-fucosidase [Capsulimonas corticalis]|uniref:alpha-L-fucosidase n=1 Tax=Capsulimonas corticalis TaxID=2219043 RepID=A0A402CUL8_9BACT|nr:alpha-L-fucosidase [Capsulimonas corticalis]BDI29007.1 alpha-L-fucosidase [Capsulimonas corticalis]